MKKQLLIATGAGLLSFTSIAQSAFEGFYVQVGIGYEYDSLTSRSFTTTGATNGAPNGTVAGASSSGSAFSGAIGLGYNFSQLLITMIVNCV